MEDFTHFDEGGYARMVNVGAKPETQRTAVAEGRHHNLIKLRHRHQLHRCDPKIL